MTCNRQKEYNEKENVNRTSAVMVCGVSVRLVFAAETNREIPEIVGRILKGAYIQHQSV